MNQSSLSTGALPPCEDNMIASCLENYVKDPHCSKLDYAYSVTITNRWITNAFVFSSKSTQDFSPLCSRTRIRLNIHSGQLVINVSILIIWSNVKKHRVLSSPHHSTIRHNDANIETVQRSGGGLFWWFTVVVIVF